MSDRERPHPDPEPVLPNTTQDESAEGWGELPERPDSDEERYLRERPPHHEG